MKRSIWAAIRGLVVGLAILGLVGTVVCGCKPVYEKLNDISVGMTYDEVVRILGLPSEGTVFHDSAGLVYGVYTWVDHIGTAEISFDSGRVTSKTWKGWG